jgi:hypothetical protein
MPSGDGFNLDQKLHPADAGSSSLSLLSLAQQADRQRNADLLNSDETTPQQSLNNIGSVYAQILPELPSAIASKLKDDCVNHTGSTLLKLGESAAFGFGASLLLARSPVLAKTLLAGAGIGTSAYMLGSAASFTAESASARTAEEQRQLSTRAINSLAKFSADFIETTPSFIAGTASGALLSPKVTALDSIAVAVRNSGEYKLRQAIPQDFHYLGFDAKRVGNIGANGELNILKAGEEAMKATPWRGVEDGRFLKAGESSIKLGSRISSERFETVMGQRTETMFHTHEKALLPTSGDFNSVYGTGIIGVPERGLLTFYEGTGREAERLSAMIKSAQSKAVDTAALASEAEAFHSQAFKALVVDPSKQLAVRVDMQWNGFANRMETRAVQPLDFASTVKNLSKWNGRLNINGIPSGAEALAKPGMGELLWELAHPHGG